MSDKHIVEYGVANVLRSRVGPPHTDPREDKIEVTKTLAEAVNEMIADGWQPFGTPFTNAITQLPAQAMVKYGDKPYLRPSAEVLTRRD